MEKNKFLRLRIGEKIKIKSDLVLNGLYDGGIRFNGDTMGNTRGIVTNVSYKGTYVDSQFISIPFITITGNSGSYMYTHDMVEYTFKFGK